MIYPDFWLQYLDTTNMIIQCLSIGVHIGFSDAMLGLSTDLKVVFFHSSLWHRDYIRCRMFLFQIVLSKLESSNTQCCDFCVF